MSNLKTPDVTTFEAAEEFLDGKTDRPLCYKTRLVRINDNQINVIHHHTSIIRYHRDGSIELSCGGWHSTTTSLRLNRFTPDTVRTNIEDRLIYVTDLRTGERTMLNGPVVITPYVGCTYVFDTECSTHGVDCPDIDFDPRCENVAEDGRAFCSDHLFLADWQTPRTRTSDTVHA